MLTCDQIYDLQYHFQRHFDESVAANLSALCENEEFLNDVSECFFEQVEVNGSEGVVRSLGVSTPIDIARDMAHAARLMELKPDFKERVVKIHASLEECGVVFNPPEMANLVLADIAYSAFLWMGANRAFDEGVGNLAWEADGCWFEYSV